MNPQAQKRLQLLQKRLIKQGIEFRPESYNWSVIQALLSRGDRRLSQLLELTRQYGDSLGSYRRGQQNKSCPGTTCKGHSLKPRY